MGTADQVPIMSHKAVLEEEIIALNEGAASSRRRAFVRLCLNDRTGAAFWYGRANGLESAAISLSLSLTATDASDQPERSAGQGTNRWDDRGRDGGAC